jgi:hypothetical protein
VKEKKRKEKKRKEKKRKEKKRKEKKRKEKEKKKKKKRKRKEKKKKRKRKEKKRKRKEKEKKRKGKEVAALKSVNTPSWKKKRRSGTEGIVWSWDQAQTIPQSNLKKSQTYACVEWGNERTNKERRILLYLRPRIPFSHAFLPHPEGGSFCSSVAALPRALVAAGSALCCVCRQPTTSEMREGKGEGSVYE